MNYKTARKIEFLQQYVRRHCTRWRRASHGEIIGVHIGLKVRRRQSLRYYSIVFHVRNKNAAPFYAIPTHLKVKVNGKYHRVPTDVIGTGEFRLYAIQPGHRAQHGEQTEIGTIGFFLKKEEDIYLCSNMHVLAPQHLPAKVYRRSIAQQQQFPPDIRLYNNDNQQAQAYLESAIFKGLDAAIARLHDKTLFYNYLPGHGIPRGVVTLTNLNMQDYPLRMYGGVSKVQHGKVSAIKAIMFYQEVKLFPLIRTDLPADYGDSGSPVFNDRHEIVGIVIGGDEAVTYVLPASVIESYFHAELITTDFSTAPALTNLPS